MKRACGYRRVRVVTASAVVLAVPGLLVVPREARAESVHSCGCVVEASCSPADDDSDDERDEPGTDVEEPAGHRRSAVPVSVDDGGLELKFSLYRGIGGGVTASFTRDAVTLTFEGGAGVGGSFSAGSVMGRSDPGVSFEARASTSSRMRFVNPPDFGLTLSRNGRMQGYMDVKTAKFRTRFRSRAVSLSEMASEEQNEAPTTRRSWSLGTEFKVTAAYGVEIPRSRFLEVWDWISALLPGGADSGPHVPPVRPGHRHGCVAVLARTAVRRPTASRRRGIGLRAFAADPLVAPDAVHVPRTGRRARAVRSRAGSRGARRLAAADDEDPGDPGSDAADPFLRSRGRCDAG